MKLSSDWWFGP